MSIEKICLGTAQLGMRYGIKNELGRQPTEAEGIEILEAAIDAGVRCIDTAGAYGTSEELLGCFGIGRRGVRVISKLRPGLQDKNQVLQEIKASMSRMGVSSIYGYLLHRAEDFEEKQIMDGLEEARAKGWTEHIGVSVYKPEDALRAAGDERIDIIQVPYNVLDQRLDETDFFELAEQNGKMVFARSAFLQGLLLMKPEALPQKLQDAGEYLARFRDICRTYEYQPREAAMLFVLYHPGIQFVVFGAETIGQLRDNLETAAKMDGFSECCSRLLGTFRGINSRIIMPNLW